MVPMPQLTYNSDGLIPAVAQDADTHEVLMMAWMDEEALRRTLATEKKPAAAVPAASTRLPRWVAMPPCLKR